MVQVSVKRKDDELYHSDTFLGEEFDDGLMHFKYVHKEKKNGKWHYYYYHKEGKNTGAVYEKTKGDKNSKYGTYEHAGGSGNYGGRTVNVKRGNSLLTKTSRQGKEFVRGEDGLNYLQDRRDGGYYETKEVGLLRQNYDWSSAKVKKFAKKTVKQAKKQINKGKKYISKLFD